MYYRMVHTEVYRATFVFESVFQMILRKTDIEKLWDIGRSRGPYKCVPIFPAWGTSRGERTFRLQSSPGPFYNFRGKKPIKL